MFIFCPTKVSLPSLLWLSSLPLLPLLLLQVLIFCPTKARVEMTTRIIAQGIADSGIGWMGWDSTPRGLTSMQPRAVLTVCAT